MTIDITTLNPGDRVRITLEGEVSVRSFSAASPYLEIKPDGTLDGIALNRNALAAPTAHIEVIEAPLVAGDPVGWGSHLIHTHGDYAWIERRDGTTIVVRLSSLRRAKP